MSTDLLPLVLTAFVVGLVHTLLGPDHYVPFIALARARHWSFGRALGITMVCGVGHILASIALGLGGILGGWAFTSVLGLEESRGLLGGWLMLGFGIAYMAWGVRHAVRGRSHSHWHTHADGTRHRHHHNHRKEHAHPHLRASGAPGLATWTLFVVFVLGPCEPLIPLFLYPAAQGAWWALAAVIVAFAAATLGAMGVMIAIGYKSLERPVGGMLERYSHALAGAAVVACGTAILFGW